MRIIIDQLTSDDSFNLEVWFVLQKIKKQSKYRLEGNDIEYRIYSPPDLQAEEMPFPIEEFRILELLEEKKAIVQKDPKDRASTFETVLSRGMRVAIVVVYLEFSEKFEDVYKEYEEKYKQIKQKLSGEDKLKNFWFDGYEFKLRLISGPPTGINFTPKKGKKLKDSFYLLSAFVEVLKKQWEIDGNKIKTNAKIADLIEEIKKLHYPNVDDLNMYWIKNTRGNLIKDIPGNLQNLVVIGYYDISSGTYPFSIEVPH